MMQVVKLLDALKKVDQKAVERELSSARAARDKAQAIYEQKEEAFLRLERFLNSQFKNARVSIGGGGNGMVSTVVETVSSYKRPVTRNDLANNTKIKKMFGRSKLTNRHLCQLSGLLSRAKKLGLVKKEGGNSNAMWTVRNAR